MSAQPARASHLLDALVVAALAVAAYCNALCCGFAYDDGLVILGNRVVREGSLAEVLVGSYWGSLAPGARSHGYRPLTILSYWAQWRVAGEAPWSWHAVNLGLHVGCAWLVLATARRVGLSRLAAMAAALLFAVHALHTEAVTGVVGRAELLATLGVLAALALHARGRTAFAAAVLALGVLGKESALVFPALAAVEDAARRRLRMRIRAYMVFAGVILGFLGLRWLVVGHPLPTFLASRLDNPLAHVGALERSWGGLGVLGRFAALHLAPLSLSADYGLGALAVPVPLSSGWPWLGLGSLVLGLGWMVHGLRSGRPVPALAAGLYVLALLPVSNLLFPIHTILGERLAYLASVGFCLGAGVALAALCRKAPGLGPLVLLALLGAHTVRTLVRNADWTDNVTLFEAAHRVTPGSARVQNNYGNVLRLRGDLPGALESYRAAARTFPDYPDAWVNQAAVLEALGRGGEAAEARARAEEARAAQAPGRAGSGFRATLPAP